MCQLQSRQPLSLKGHYSIITCQACHCGSQISVIFKELSVNMISTSHPEDGDEEMIQSDTDPWIKHLNTLWDIRFEQREAPTEDKIIQINLGDEANPKPIFISESLSPLRRRI